ncbi:MAG: hypothetical protein IJS63_04410 [Bacteroidaceae bacterium]|nr:hypothetical protein [Bacteroidaceae bacterium]
MKTIRILSAALTMMAAIATTAIAADVTRDAHGIIREQPEGIHRLYMRSGGATYAPIYFQTVTQDGIATEMVFSEDGTKAYFKNIISHAATDTWVEGNVSDGKITVPLGQLVYWFDGGYGLQLALVEVKGNITTYTSKSTGSVTFTMQGNDLYLEGTSANPDETTYVGLGLTYTGQYNGEWSYYLDYETVLTYKDVTIVDVPKDLETSVYSMEYEQSGHLVNVGFKDNDVYVQGISENNIPNAWWKGTVQGDGKLVFPLQFAQVYSTYLLYFCGADFQGETTADGGTTWNYLWTDGSATFDFDREAGSFSSQQAVFINNADDHVERGEIFRAPRFRPYTEKAGTPSDPSIYTYIDYFDLAGFSIMMPIVPLLDTEGNFMDPSKVSWQIFVDDDEPFTLYPDEYKYLTEAIDEIPYLYTPEQQVKFSRSYIYEKAYGIYIFETGFRRIGVQTIYRGGGEEHRSNIGWHYFGGDAVHSIAADDPSGEMQHFDISGRRVNNNHRGITITRLPDGRVLKQLR